MSSGDESAGALGTLFFYVMFVHPVCAWILAPKRFKKEKALAYAIIFLGVVALGKMVRGGARDGRVCVCTVEGRARFGCESGLCFAVTRTSMPTCFHTRAGWLRCCEFQHRRPQRQQVKRHGLIPFGTESLYTDNLVLVIWDVIHYSPPVLSTDTAIRICGQVTSRWRP